MDLHQFINHRSLKLHSVFFLAHFPKTAPLPISFSIRFLVRFGGEETYGGNALAYRSSLRIAVRPLEPLGSWNGPKDVKAVRTMLEVVSTALLNYGSFFLGFGAEMDMCKKLWMIDCFVELTYGRCGGYNGYEVMRNPKTPKTNLEN